jgi:myo-inositol 2-dehydrogenase/D-chiro-inositol 1-dehydrogenase
LADATKFTDAEAYKQTKVRGMYQVEHDELFASIRANKPMNDGEWMTRSNLLALAGRMAAYSGQTITFDQALNSSEVLFPEIFPGIQSTTCPSLYRGLQHLNKIK